MEKTLTTEERIRRAEELYNRRKMQNLGVRVTSTAKTPESKKDIWLLKKMILQILICLVIYFIFYLIQNGNYIFSEEVISRTKDILSKDINFAVIYEQVTSYMANIQKDFEENSEDKSSQDQEQSQEQNLIEEQMIENSQEESEGMIQNPVTEENIGGAELENIVSPEEEVKQLSQMELDANEIKQNYELIYPIRGTITSRYGPRNPTTASVPKNHTGIDIAANTGTVIKAALEGTVEIASLEGDYGKHLKIVKDDVAIIYAHCSKLYLKKGDVVQKGDPIGEVGATGNVTGPHLHFEIRKQERYVNPDLIIQF